MAVIEQGLGGQSFETRATSVRGRGTSLAKPERIQESEDGMQWFYWGIDLGQSRDPSAMALIERAELKGEFDRAVWAYEKKTALWLRYLDRVQLGTPYPDVADRVVTVTNNPQVKGRSHVAVDATGVGRPVVDLLRRGRPGGLLQPVTITGGQRETFENGLYSVPKRDLIIGLQIAIQRGELLMARDMAFARTLMEELEAMEVRISAAGNEQYAAWRQGTHDDLVFAVALAYWSARKHFPEDGTGKKRWWTREDQGDLGRVFRGI